MPPFLHGLDIHGVLKKEEKKKESNGYTFFDNLEQQTAKGREGRGGGAVPPLILFPFYHDWRISLLLRPRVKIKTSSAKSILNDLLQNACVNAISQFSFQDL